MGLGTGVVWECFPGQFIESESDATLCIHGQVRSGHPGQVSVVKWSVSGNLAGQPVKAKLMCSRVSRLWSLIAL